VADDPGGWHELLRKVIGRATSANAEITGPSVTSLRHGCLPDVAPDGADGDRIDGQFLPHLQAQQLGQFDIEEPTQVAATEPKGRGGKIDVLMFCPTWPASSSTLCSAPVRRVRGCHATCTQCGSR